MLGPADTKLKASFLQTTLLTLILIVILLLIVCYLNRRICGASSGGHIVQLYDPHNHIFFDETEDLDIQDLDNDEIDTSMVR